MAYNVLFLQGTQEKYNGLVTKDANTFYLTETNLYLGNKKLTSAAEVAAAVARIKVNEGDISTIETNIGDVEALSTTNKTLVTALNELKAAIGAGGTAATLTITGNATDGYVFKQGNATVGTISIPKDMVVSSGQVVVNPEGQTAGTYLELTLANATNDKVYINVGTLVDIYKAAEKVTQVQLVIDSVTREISATIVAGSITATELAANAVTTEKIADGNVTKAKLSETVQTSLGKADTAVQSIDTGSTQGTISVDRTNVAVAGLNSGAFADISQYQTTAEATTTKEQFQQRIGALEAAVGEGGSVETQIDSAIGELNATKDSGTVADGQGVKVTVAQVDGLLTSVAVEGNYDDLYDAKGAAATAKSEAVTAAANDATTKAEAALSAAQTYADQAETDAVASAKTYTDSSATATLTSAKEYADQAEADAITAASSDATTKANAAQAAAINAASEDATTKADTALASAKTYADGLAGNYDAKGSASAAETAAKEYTDTALTWGSF